MANMARVRGGKSKAASSRSTRGRAAAHAHPAHLPPGRNTWSNVPAMMDRLDELAAEAGFKLTKTAASRIRRDGSQKTFQMRCRAWAHPTQEARPLPDCPYHFQIIATGTREYEVTQHGHHNHPLQPAPAGTPHPLSHNQRDVAKRMVHDEGRSLSEVTDKVREMLPEGAVLDEKALRDLVRGQEKRRGTLSDAEIAQITELGGSSVGAVSDNEMRVRSDFSMQLERLHQIFGLAAHPRKLSLLQDLKAMLDKRVSTASQQNGAQARAQLSEDDN